MVEGTEKDSLNGTLGGTDLGPSDQAFSPEAGEGATTRTDDTVPLPDSDIVEMTPAGETYGETKTLEKLSLNPEETASYRGARFQNAQVRLIPADKFREQIDGLRLAHTIKNEKGEEIAFEGATKDEFIRFCEEGYPVLEKMMETVYETGRFLHEVRMALKPKRLFLTWMNFTGLQERRSYRYLKVYERFGDRLPDFAHLGIRKLLAASKLKDCVGYLDEQREDAEKQTAEQFEQTIRERMAGNMKVKTRRKPSYEEIDGLKLSRTEDGKRLVIDGLSKERQNELFERIRALLSEDKNST